MRNRIFGYVNVTLMLLIVSVALLSCFLSFYNPNINNLFTDVGLKWIADNSLAWFSSLPLAQIIIVIAVIGMVSESGLMYAIYGHKSLKQKRALLFTAIVLGVICVLAALSVLLPKAPLLSVFGSVSDSPFMHGLFMLVSFVMFILTAVYGYVAGNLSTVGDYVQAGTSFFGKAAPYFITLLISSQLIGVVDYIGILSLTSWHDFLLSALRAILLYAPGLLIFYKSEN